MKSKFVSLLPAIAWFVFIYILLTLPGKDFPKSDLFEIIYFDKWVHIGLFGGLVFLFSYPFKNTFPFKNSFYLLIVVLAVVYGVAMEFVQKYFTTDRSFDINDMMANAVGALLGYLFFRFIARKHSEKK